MNIYLLLEFVIIIFIMSLVFTRDIFSPSCIICESYILAVISAIWNIDKWNVNLHSNTIFIITIGIVIFCIISWIINYGYSKNRKYNKKDIQPNFIKFDKRIMLLLIAIQGICLIIYAYFFIKALGDLSQYESFNYMMRYFRFFVNIEEDIPTIINQLIKVSKAITYVCSFIFIHNMIVSKKIKQKRNEKYLLVSLFIFSIMSLLTGGRFEIMILILAIIMMWYIIISIYNNNKTLSINTIIKIIGILIIAIILFSVMKLLVGRQSESSIIDYFTEYFGGSIQIFDIYLQDGTNYIIDGRGELFADLLKLLEKFKIIDSRPDNSQLAAYIESNGVVIGNVYTGFRKMIHDFGILGIIIFQGLFSVIITVYYEKLKNMKQINKISLGIIFYAAISFTIFLHSYSEFFFSTIISFNYIAFLFLLYVMKIIVQRVRI